MSGKTLVHYFDPPERAEKREWRTVVPLACTPSEARRSYRAQRRYRRDGQPRRLAAGDARTSVLATYGVTLTYRSAS